MGMMAEFETVHTPWLTIGIEKRIASSVPTLSWEKAIKKKEMKPANHNRKKSNKKILTYKQN